MSRELAASSQEPREAKSQRTENGKGPGAHRQGIDVVAVNGRPGSQPRPGPSTHPADSEGAQGDHPVAVCAVHDPQVPHEQSHERNLGQSVGLSARGIGSHGGLAQGMARLEDTLQLLGATDDWNPASQRFTLPLTSSGARAEIDQQLVRLRLLNSSNTCYMNAAVVAWLHITNRLNCSDRQAYGSRMQAWRDIMQSLRPLHVHTLASRRNILAGWRDLHRQQDASEFLEYWVAVGRPQIVVGTWEARIENQQLIEIRHHSSTDVALDLDLEQSHTPQSLQQLIFAWHTQQLGIQAFQNPLVILMIRLSRFRQVQGQMQKVTTPVIIAPRVNIPVFDDDTLQCTNVPYHVWSVILHAGHSPHAGHCASRLLAATADGASGVQWSTDDARLAKLVMREVLQDQNLSQQAYVLLLGRGSAAREQ